MQIRQIALESLDETAFVSLREIDPQLVLLFGSVKVLGGDDAFACLAAAVPSATLAGCSTAGEISGDGVSEGGLVATAIRFDGTRHRVADVALETMKDSRAAGVALGELLRAPDLTAILLFGKGVDVNGSAIIEGLTSVVGAHVPISGGLAGDDGAFKETLTLTPSGIHRDRLVGIGLYGDRVRVEHASFGGWAPFGPARKVTRAEGNVLLELDGRPALELYRQYLGEYAKDLPASGLLFPFEMLDHEKTSIGLIRTILGIDEARGALVLAGDIDEEGFLRLMHASRENLVDGAETAAKRVKAALGVQTAEGLAVLVSCVGRKLVMGDAVEDEVEAVTATLGKRVATTGFYSYGEIAPFSSTTDCKLHNQTMTVTFIGEA